MVLFFSALLMGGAVFYVVYTLKRAAELSDAESRLSMDWNGVDGDKPFQAPIYLKLTRPLLKEAYLEIATGFWKPEQIEYWRRKLTAAGLNRYIQAEHFVAAKFWFTLEVLGGSLLFYLFGQDTPAWMPVVFPLLAFFIANFDVDTRIQERQLQVRQAMPYVVDLLTLSTEAGLDFMGSIGKVVDRAPPSPLIDELAIVLKDIQLGKTRADALRAMADRIDMSEMKSFVATLVSAESMGASIGTVLRAQSDSMRTERLVKAEKLGAQASQKILIPLVFFILPCVMLMIFAPIILQYLGVK